MKNIPLLLGTIFGTLILIFLVGFMFSKQTSTSNSTVALDPALVAGDKRLVKGAENAAITVVEFSDFQCPACKSTYPLTKELMAQYGDKIQFVYRHFPLDSVHPNARLASAASEVAFTYGKFWEMHDVLFEKQEEWADIDDKTALKAKFADYAQELQIDKSEFLTKIEEESYAELVQKDSVAGTQIDVLATPTFYVNGSKTPAPQLKSVVQSLIDQNVSQ